MTDATPQIRLLKFEEVQARLQCGRTFVYQRIAAGDLVAVRLGPKMARITSDSLDAYIVRLVQHHSDQAWGIIEREGLSEDEH